MPLRSRRTAAAKVREAIAAEADLPSPSQINRHEMSLPPHRSFSYNPSNSPKSPKSRATVSKEPPSSPSKNDGSLRLTVKMPPSKLASVGTSAVPRASGTRGVAQKVVRRKSGNVIQMSSREQFEGGEILEGRRARATKKYVVSSESEEEDEDAAGDEVDKMDVDSATDADGDEEGDFLDPKGPSAPKIRSQGGTITVRPSPKKASRTADQQQIAVQRQVYDDDSDELSDIESEMEQTMGMEDDEEDAEGDDDEEVEVEEDEDNVGSDDDTPGGGSRASTPDLSKLTRRQRARLEEGGSGHLLALPDEVQVKKHLTAEEHAMRRAEMARRRKNLSEKRNEEEKMDTINKLLKKQAPKTNKRRLEFNGPGATEGANGEPAKPSAVYVRWVSRRGGNSVSVPGEWLEGPVGGMFMGGVKAGGGIGGGGVMRDKMVEEVQ